MINISFSFYLLAHSGKWPGEINAFRCLKAAFHLQISERLNKQYNLLTQAYDSYIDVLKNGFIFRLLIAHAKEITLLRRNVEKGVVKFKETEESLTFQRESFLLPRLRGALHGYVFFILAVILINRGMPVARGYS